MPRKPPEDEEVSSDLLTALEQGVRSILSNRKATRSEKVQAITAGTKLLQIRHKIKGGGDDGSFFGGE